MIPLSTTGVLIEQPTEVRGVPLQMISPVAAESIAEIRPAPLAKMFLPTNLGAAVALPNPGFNSVDQFTLPVLGLRLLMDGGGSNSASRYIFRHGLQAVVNSIGIEIRVAH